MKTIFLTGISRGIGLNIFKLLNSKHNFIGVTRNKLSFFGTVPSEINNHKNKILEIDFDITPEESWNSYYNKITSQINSLDCPIDVFINNSGVAHFAPFVELAEDALRNEYFVNSIAPTILMKLILSKMISQKKGLFINISSIATRKAFENASIYSASKSAIIGLTNSIREEVRKYNIKVVNLILGATDTDIWDENTRNEYRSRMILPENVAKIVDNIIELSEMEDFMIEEIVVKPQLGDL